MTLILSLLSRFYLQWLLVLIGLTGLLSVFDLLANAGTVLKFHPGEILPLWHYTLLRMQQILCFVLPLAVLLATMILLARMVLSQEMVILRSVGISVYYIIAILGLATAVIAFAHLAFANTILTRNAGIFYQWQAADFRGLPSRASMNVATDWVAVGNSFLRVESVSNHGRELRHIVLLERDEKNVIQSYLTAESAFYDKGMWMMRGVQEIRTDGRPTPKADVQLKDIPFKPEALSLIGVREEELSYGDLWVLMDAADEGRDSSRPYQFWFHHKLAVPFSSFIMLLIAAPIALQLARRNRLLIASFTCIMAGFGFYVLQQLLASLGETGVLPPILAAWSPILLGAAVMNWILLHWET